MEWCKFLQQQNILVFLFDGGSHYGCWAKETVVEPVSNDNKKDVFDYGASLTV